MKKLYRSFCAVPGVFLGVLFLVAITPAVSGQPTVVPDLTLRAPGLGIAFTHTPDQAAFQLEADGKGWQLKAPYVVPGAPWLTVRELRFDADPLIYGNVLVQNMTGVSQTFNLAFSLPTTWAAPNLIRGSIDTSIIGTDGLISAQPGSSIYSAQIDSSTVQTLQDYPFTLSTPQNAVSQSAQFGFDPSAIAVTSSIGILLNFELSPQDFAAIISDFEVVAIPEPGSLALLLLGGVLVWRRQRR